MAVFAVHEAKTNLSKLIAQSLGGEDVVIAKGKHPSCGRCQSKRSGSVRRVDGRGVSR